jgi:hypothetical protein
MPDWLSAMEPAAESAPEAEAEPVDAGDFATIAAEASSLEPAQAEIPDWLTSMEPAEAAAPPIAQAAADIPVKAAAPETLDTSVPDWVAEASIIDQRIPSSEPLDIEEPAAEAPVEELPAEPAPDWLTQMYTPVQADQVAVVAEAEAVAADETLPAGTEAEAAPDWMTAMYTEAPAESAVTEPASPPAAAALTEAAEPVVTDEQSEFQWDVTEPTTAGETPDWLAQIKPADEPEPAAPAEPAAAFDWMQDLGPGQTVEAVEEEPAWLSEVEVADESEKAAVGAPSGDASFDWMSTLQEQEEGEPETAGEAALKPAAEQSDFEWGDAQPATAGDSPAWLSELGPADTEAKPAPEPAVAAAPSEFDWMDALQSDEEKPQPEAAEPASSDMPDWLAAAAPAQTTTPAPERANGDMSWLDALNAPDAEPEAEAEQPADQADQFDFDQVAEAEEVGAPAPATNAPDWLNAMVPGLDVDYAAQEDEPIEKEFAPSPADAEPSQTRQPRDFDWLVNIVEEESQQIAAVQMPGTRRRWVFSRPPVWLREPIEKLEPPSRLPEAKREADDLDDDIDLPPWLQ